MDISFKIDPEVLIGENTLSMAGAVTSRHGQRVMVVAENGLGAQNISRLKEILEDSALDVIVYDRVDDRVSAEMADNIVQLSNAAQCDAIIGFGGYNTQIIARLSAMLAPSKISFFELLDGKVNQNKFLPFISIPTEGTNAFSFTNYFIASDPRFRFVKLIKSPVNLCSALIIDSTLFNFVSGDTAPFSVFEGLFFATEAYCSSKANFFSDTILEKALAGFAKLIKKNPGGFNPDGIYYASLAQALFLASVGSSLSSPGIGTALAASIEIRTPIARSKCSAALLPVIAQKLVSSRPEKMARLANLLGVPKAATVAETATASIDVIRRSLNTHSIPLDLKDQNIPLEKIINAGYTARKLDFVSYSPWPVSEEEIFNIFKEIF